jgi:Spy/CpxP family protein refolding chaperone
MQSLLIALLAASLCLPAGANAQHLHGTPPPVAHPHTSAGMSEADLLAGAGGGLAQVADVNGYPGPKHVLEFADALALTGTQRVLTTRLRDETFAKAREAGKALVDAERALAARFAGGRITEPELAAALERIGDLQARLRGIHLRAHLRQRGLLTTIQQTRYGALRQGVAAPAADPAHSPGSHDH